jgi:hypothetical protein
MGTANGMDLTRDAGMAVLETKSPYGEWVPMVEQACALEARIDGFGVPEGIVR